MPNRRWSFRRRKYVLRLIPNNDRGIKNKAQRNGQLFTHHALTATAASYTALEDTSSITNRSKTFVAL